MTRLRVAFLILVLTMAALAIFGCAPQTIEDGLPPIPIALPSQLGPVKIIWRDSLTDEHGEPLWGGFAPAERIIYLNTAVRGNRAFAFAVLYHESCHVDLQDTGLRNLIPPQVVQVLCDALASRRVAELRLRWP